MKKRMLPLITAAAGFTLTLATSPAQAGWLQELVENTTTQPPQLITFEEMVETKKVRERKSLKVLVTNTDNESLTLSTQKKAALLENFVESGLPQFYYLGKALVMEKDKFSLLNNLIEAYKKAVKAQKEDSDIIKTLSKVITNALLYSAGQTRDKAYASNLSIPTNNPYKDLSDFYLAAIKSQEDGLLNKIIRDIVRSKNDWTQQERELGFDFLWNALTATAFNFGDNPSAKEILEQVKTTALKNPLSQEIINGFLQCEGNSFVEKFSNYVSLYLLGQLEQIIEKQGCCGSCFNMQCFTACYSGTKTMAPLFIKVVKDYGPTIIETIKLIIEVTKGIAGK